MTESGIMTYDEITKFAEEGRECQMRVGDKWVKLNLKAVIHEFRIAPSLYPTRHDGRRVLRSALYYLERTLMYMCETLLFSMPKNGPKIPWTVTGDCQYTVLTKKAIRNVFKTYFRIVEETADGKPPMYRVLMRPVDGYGWVRCFSVRYLEYDGYEQYEHRQYFKPDPGTHDWGIVLDQEFGWTKISENGIEIERYDQGNKSTVRVYLQCHEYVDSKSKMASNVIVYEQRVPTLDTVEIPAQEVCYNIALKMYDMLRVIAGIDARAKSIENFIDIQLKESTRPTYYITTEQGPKTGRNISIGHIKEAISEKLREYLTAVYGSSTYGHYYFYMLAKGFFLRYLNDKYEGTIDYVLVHP
jgi:hypothetical protein